MKYFDLLCLIALPVVVLLIIGGVKSHDRNTYIASHKIQYNEAINSTYHIPRHLLSSKLQTGDVIFQPSNARLSEQDIHQYINSQNSRDNAHPLMWLDKQKPAVLSAMGIDRQHHFASSYLVGVRPFAVENNWLPLYTIANRKTYQLDSLQYNAGDIWQNSAQAFELLRGDCEDHAILLADWLISENIDARVAVGTYKQEGHAWVVAFINGQTFVLEATSKRKTKAWNQYPLAELAVDYHPKYMFNREQFWVNNGSEFTTNYTSENWRTTAKFEKPTKQHAL